MLKTGNNKVELLGTYGGDTEHACSAWTSTSRDLTAKNSKGVAKIDRIQPLLNMLAKDGHHTPFEKSALHFLCTTEIATHIHLLKHRIGVSINGESARYKELNNDKCYVPFDWDKTQQEKYLLFMENAYQQYHEVLEDLEVNYKAGGMKKKDARKRAKESARFYLPYGNQIDCDIQFNFRSFYHFLKLRYSAHAQSEVRVLARSMLEAVHNTGDFNKTLIAFELLDPETNLLLEPFQ